MHRGRRLSIRELLRLQGFPEPGHGLNVVVSDRQLGEMVGDAMNVTVMARLVQQLLASVKTAHHEWEDPRDVVAHGLSASVGQGTTVTRQDPMWGG